MRHLDLFSGIGGFRLAVESVWPQCELHAFVEIDTFCQGWLKANWPGCKIYGDIRTYKHDGTNIDILTGGFPCQPFSVAGKRTGKNDNRYLWPEMLRVIQEASPTWIIGENVPGILTIDHGLVFERVCLDLEAEGYEVTPFIIPACAVNAPHRRDRVWIVAHSKYIRPQRDKREKLYGIPERKYEPFGGSGGSLANPISSKRNIKRRQAQRGIAVAGPSQGGMADTMFDRTRRRNNADTQRVQRALQVKGRNCGYWDDSEYITGYDGKARRVKPGLRLLAHGFPLRNDLLRGFGNAIVPQVAAKIMQAIKEAKE